MWAFQGGKDEARKRREGGRKEACGKGREGERRREAGKKRWSEGRERKETGIKKKEKGGKTRGKSRQQGSGDICLESSFLPKSRMRNQIPNYTFASVLSTFLPFGSDSDTFDTVGWTSHLGLQPLGSSPRKAFPKRHCVPCRCLLTHQQLEHCTTHSINH